MEAQKTTPAWQYDNEEERRLAEHIIGLEEAALEKFFKGDTSGYQQLWSKKSFSYYDAVVTERVDSHAKICEFLMNVVEGKLRAYSYDVRSPRVQFGKDMAVLTYQLFAKTNIIDTEYNCIEVFQKEADGEWHVIHSTWSVIRPMDKDFGKAKEMI